MAKKSIKYKKYKKRFKKPKPKKNTSVIINGTSGQLSYNEFKERILILEGKQPKQKLVFKSVKQIKGETYYERNHILTQMGYNSYEEYLSSPLWKKIREKFLKKYFSCYICKKRATVVHHKKYNFNTLSGNNDKGLVSLCHDHHTEIEFDGTKKLFLKDANKKLTRIKHKRGVY